MGLSADGPLPEEGVSGRGRAGSFGVGRNVGRGAGRVREEGAGLRQEVQEGLGVSVCLFPGPGFGEWLA